MLDIELVDQSSDFLHVAWGGADDQRIRTVVGQHTDADTGSPANVLVCTRSHDEEFANSIFGIDRRSMLQAEHSQSVAVGDRLVELLDEVQHGLDRFLASDQQQRVRCIESGDADFPLPCRKDVFVELRQQIRDGVAVGVLQPLDLDLRASELTLRFDLRDQASDPFDITSGTSDNDHPELLDELDVETADDPCAPLRPILQFRLRCVQVCPRRWLSRWRLKDRVAEYRAASALFCRRSFLLCMGLLQLMQQSDGTLDRCRFGLVHPNQLRDFPAIIRLLVDGPDQLLPAGMLVNGSDDGHGVDPSIDLHQCPLERFRIELERGPLPIAAGGHGQRLADDLLDPVLELTPGDAGQVHLERPGLRRHRRLYSRFHQPLQVGCDLALGVVRGHHHQLFVPRIGRDGDPRNVPIAKAELRRDLFRTSRRNRKLA